MSTDYLEFRERLLQNPKTKAAYDALEAEDKIIRAMIEAEIQSGLTSEALSEKTGISQDEINKLEQGGGNPSLNTLQRLAAGLGMRLRLEFQPATA